MFKSTLSLFLETSPTVLQKSGSSKSQLLNLIDKLVTNFSSS